MVILSVTWEESWAHVDLRRNLRMALILRTLYEYQKIDQTYAGH